jgi:hypothetical protein
MIEQCLTDPAASLRRYLSAASSRPTHGGSDDHKSVVRWRLSGGLDGFCRQYIRGAPLGHCFRGRRVIVRRGCSAPVSCRPFSASKLDLAAVPNRPAHATHWNMVSTVKCLRARHCVLTRSPSRDVLSYETSTDVAVQRNCCIVSVAQ